jgi:hypothetical protein
MVFRCAISAIGSKLLGAHEMCALGTGTSRKVTWPSYLQSNALKDTSTAIGTALL